MLQCPSQRPPLFALIGGSGQGKSTFSAALVAEGRLAGAGGTWDVLYHFCKHNDARRQDPIAVICSLACQLCSLPSKLGEHAAAGERMRCRQPAAALPTGLDSGTCDTQNRLCPNAAAGLVGLTADQIREAFKSVDAAFNAAAQVTHLSG